MRFQIMSLLFLFSSSLAHAVAVNDEAMNELFKKYDQVMEEKKLELIDEVFTKKFLRENGGKKEFASKVKELPPEKNLPETKVSWRKGTKDQVVFAKIKAKKEKEGPEFIVTVEDNKLKINGTLSDDE